ncbi:MAG: DUF4124 domain-containing protein [Thermodesulfobacteriota bacterium]|nr:MAG: DUF4124 domain-containing protein [Thermodesulfobacteriota bacterium]
MRLIPFLLAALVLAPPAYAELYYWTDGQGNVHITDSLEKVPQEWRGKVRVQKEEEAPKGPQFETETPPPLPVEPGAVLYGDQTFDWWRISLARKKGEINELQQAINVKTNYVEVFEAGRRFGQVFASEQVAKYNLYKEELPADLRNLAALREEYGELQRKARIAGVPKEAREP